MIFCVTFLALQPILSDMSIIPCSGLVSVYMEYHSPFLYFEPLCILKAEVPLLQAAYGCVSNITPHSRKMVVREIIEVVEGKPVFPDK